MTKVMVGAAKAGKFTAAAVGLEVVSRTPFFSMARKLLADGLANHETELEMVWFGSSTVAMTGKAGALAKLTVREDDQRGPRVARWKAPSFGAVSPRNRSSDGVAGCVAGTKAALQPLSARVG